MNHLRPASDSVALPITAEIIEFSCIAHRSVRKKSHGDSLLLIGGFRAGPRGIFGIFLESVHIRPQFSVASPD